MADLSPTSNSGVRTTIILVVVVAVLYFAREVFIPIALALLFAFLLTPLVVRLRHWGLGRVASVLTVVILGFLIVAIIGSLMALQLTDLAHRLPQYQQNFHQKIESLRVSSGGIITRLSKAAQEISKELSPQPSATGAPGEEKPVPVEIRRNPFSPLQIVQTILGSLFGVLLTTVLVVVFVIFMLVQREDLRDRIICLVGLGQLNLTTQALDEAGQRVSRYLLAQLAVNAIYGLLAGIGLYFLDIPNPVLWGVFAAVFRYLPYLGIWIAAIMPAAVAIAVSTGWLKAVGILGLYFGIDVLMYNFVEPLVYGSSTGISPMAIIVAAVFWTWLWGPVGLLLSTPLTVCTVVIGRYVPSLEFLSILLSDEEVLSPEKRFYQRLLAMDVEEATEVAQNFLKHHSVAELYDKIIIPALTLAEEDRHKEKLDSGREHFIVENVRLLVELFGEHNQPKIESAEAAGAAQLVREPEVQPMVVSMPARDEADEIGALMLSLLLNRRGLPTKSLPLAALASERLNEVAPATVKIACVCAVPPSGYMHARYMCKRLRARFPDLKIIAAILNGGDAEEVKLREPRIAADEVATNLGQAVTEIVAFSTVSSAPGPPLPALRRHVAES